MKSLPILFLALLCSCATLFDGGPDHIPVDSEPPGAQVFLDGTAVGTTPMVVVVGRKSECVLMFQLAGHQTQTVDIDKVLNGWIFGNILIGGGIGIIIDLVTSNQGKYPEMPVFVDLDVKS